jgi:hypothetical protein
MANVVGQISASVSDTGLLSAGDWIAIGAAFIALVGVAVAIVALVQQIRALRKQLFLQTFSDYTKRYQEIILHFPEDINQSDFDLSSRNDRSSVMRYMRAYYDLCFEEFHLFRMRLIDQSVWESWREGMEVAFSKTAFQQSWDQIKTDTQYGDDFCALVEGAHNRRATP